MDKFSRLIVLVTFLSVHIEMICSAAVYSQSKPPFDPFEQICSNKTERFFKSDGKESSLFLEFHSTNSQLKNHQKLCERNLTAPESHGFIVRLVMPKVKKSLGKHLAIGGGSSSSSSANTFRGMMMNNQKISSTNSTKSCPLSIYSQSDLMHKKPLWRIDPCHLEGLVGNQEDPVRLFDGHLNIVWEHRHNSIDSKLMVTALGKGYGCRFGNKHPCLKVGDEALFCISKDLICDNIRHCPKGDEYNSDEDFEMCSKLNRPVASVDDGDFWEHLTMEIFKNFFTSDTTLTALDINLSSDDADDDSGNNNDDDTTKLSDLEKHIILNNDGLMPSRTLTNIDQSDIHIKKSTDPNTNENDEKQHTNATKSGSLSSDLSKYGPWGYLMLGMLLCGGALLVCGLWECCCRHQKNDTNLNGSTVSSGGGGSGIDSIEPPVRIHQDSTPPNYDELDPPPAYSILFPNQKAQTTDGGGFITITPSTSHQASTDDISQIIIVNIPHESISSSSSSNSNSNSSSSNSSTDSTQISSASS